MEAHPIHFRKQLSLSQSLYEDERLLPPPAVTPPRCLSTEMLASEEDLLRTQLGEFWSFAVDLPNRFHQEVSHLNQPEDSLERQFLYQDYLTKPAQPETPHRHRKVIHSICDEPDTVLRGEDINDVPCSYVISGLEQQEFPVIGTYVDRRVLPGFRYLIRLNQTNRYLFEGRALLLQSIGLGYGKRLTFQADHLNDNDNYFWSDSRPEGYGFGVVAVENGDVLGVTALDNKQSGDKIESLRVVDVLSQEELETFVRPNGDVVKKVKVHFSYVDDHLEINSNEKAPSELRGIAFLVKSKGAKSCQLERIQVDETVGASHRAMELRPPTLYA